MLSSYMVKNRRSQSVINEMKSLLTYYGWESMELLPHGWFFKRIWKVKKPMGGLFQMFIIISLTKAFCLRG